MSLETVSLENKGVSALNVVDRFIDDDIDDIYIYLYNAWAVSTTGGII